MCKIVILDIDQDVLFEPGPPINDTDSKQYCKKEDMSQVLSIKQILDRFNVIRKPYKIFVNHYEAYHEIKRLNYKVQKLIHVDRHDDLDKEEYNTADLHIGNWISWLIKDDLIETIDWIKFDEDLDFISTTTTPVSGEKSIPLYISNLNNCMYDGKIDYVFFTISPGFCKNNTHLLKFLELMEPKYYKDVSFI